MPRAMDTTARVAAPSDAALGYGVGLAAKKRVQLHPATDRWMRGDCYGTIEAPFRWRGRTRYRVKMDKSGQTVVVIAENLKVV